MKKLDGRSKEGKAMKARQAAKNNPKLRKFHEVEEDHVHESDAPVIVGGVGLRGDRYVPLDLSASVSAFDTQEGGDHYKKLAIQPMVYSFKNKLDPAQHTAIKYITRFRDKDGRKDLEKAKHVIDLLIEMEYGL